MFLSSALKLKVTLRVGLSTTVWSGIEVEIKLHVFLTLTLYGNAKLAIIFALPV
jgi:hypothetical protein